MSQIETRHIFDDERDIWEQMVRQYDPKLTSQQIDVAWDRIWNGNNRGRCIIGMADKEIVSFMHYIHHDTFFHIGPVVYLSDLFVKPDFRQRGLASALIGDLILSAKSRHWERIHWVTEEDNYVARCMYDKFAQSGFVRFHLDLNK